MVTFFIVISILFVLWSAGGFFSSLRWILLGICLGIILSIVFYFYYHSSSNPSFFSNFIPHESNPNTSTCSCPNTTLSKHKEWVPSEWISPCAEAICALMETKFPSLASSHPLLQSLFGSILSKLNSSQPLPMDYIIRGILALFGNNIEHSSIVQSIMAVLKSFGLSRTVKQPSSSVSYCSSSSSLSSSSLSLSLSSSENTFSDSYFEEWGIRSLSIASMNLEQKQLLFTELERVRNTRSYSDMICPITLDNIFTTTPPIRMTSGNSVLFESSHCYFYRTHALEQWFKQKRERINPLTRQVIDSPLAFVSLT